MDLLSAAEVPPITRNISSPDSHAGDSYLTSSSSSSSPPHGGTSSGNVSGNACIFGVILFLLCVTSAMFSCLISHSARKIGRTSGLSSFPATTHRVLQSISSSINSHPRPNKLNHYDVEEALLTQSRYSETIHQDQMLY